MDLDKNMVEGRGSSDEPMTRRKNILRRCNDQIVDTADPYINPLDHLDSFSFLIRRQTVYIKGYGSTKTQITSANV